MCHKILPPQAKTLEELGQLTGELRYDALIVVLVGIADSLESQARSDMQKDRPHLSGYGRDVVLSLHQTVSILERMLTIAVPHMHTALQEHPLLGQHGV